MSPDARPDDRRAPLEVLIVEDEPYHMARLCQNLQLDSRLSLAGAFSGGAAALVALAFYSYEHIRILIYSHSSYHSYFQAIRSRVWTSKRLSRLRNAR